MIDPVILGYGFLVILSVMAFEIIFIVKLLYEEWRDKKNGI